MGAAGGECPGGRAVEAPHPKRLDGGSRAGEYGISRPLLYVGKRGRVNGDEGDRGKGGICHLGANVGLGGILARGMAL